MPKNLYDAYCYDENFVLKVTPFLWLAIIWSIHHSLLLALSSFAKSGYVFAIVKSYAASAPMLMSDIPGIIVLFARLKRSPGAGAKIRWLWRHGAKFLVAGLSISTIVMLGVHQREIADPENFMFWIVAANLGFIVYLSMSRRVRGIFADFPAPIEASEGSKAAKKPPD